MSQIVRRAAKIMLIRHAEKPHRSPLVHGVTASGKHDPESLTVRGWQRAGALVGFFAPPNGICQHAAILKPQFLYASKPVVHPGSRRSFETIMPLAEKMAVKINSSFLKTEAQEMIVEALSCKGTVLICWTHENLPEIANYILGNKTIAPQRWTANRFDVVWVFDKEFKSDVYRFRQVSQNLLKGDSPLSII